MKNPDEWRRRDAWLGVLFLFVGVLLLAYTVLALQTSRSVGMPVGMPVGLRVGAALLGPLFLALGGNALFRSWRAGRWFHVGTPPRTQGQRQPW